MKFWIQKFAKFFSKCTWFLPEIHEILLHNFNVFTRNSCHFAPKNSRNLGLQNSRNYIQNVHVFTRNSRNSVTQISEIFSGKLANRDIVLKNSEIFLTFFISYLFLYWRMPYFLKRHRMFFPHFQIFPLPAWPWQPPARPSRQTHDFKFSRSEKPLGKIYNCDPSGRECNLATSCFADDIFFSFFDFRYLSKYYISTTVIKFYWNWFFLNLYVKGK